MKIFPIYLLLFGLAFSGTPSKPIDHMTTIGIKINPNLPKKNDIKNQVTSELASSSHDVFVFIPDQGGNPTQGNNGAYYIAVTSDVPQEVVNKVLSGTQACGVQVTSGPFSDNTPGPKVYIGGDRWND